jgi:hypothetical protein
MTTVSIMPESTSLTNQFFVESQRNRLAELMDRWRIARDAGAIFPAADQVELDQLVAAELQASAQGANALLGELRP